jgi:threonine dehydrogenase-like Zn-dependent dehydrogenase
MRINKGEKLMQAAVMTGPRQIELREIRRPSPSRGEVRVQLEGCGVCASNLAMWEGMPWSQYPTDPGSPGHEGWGYVDAVGPEVEGIKEGDRVAFLGFHSYAECDLVASSSLVLLPSFLDCLPFPGEAFACAMNIFERSDIHAGQTVAIVGIGFLGAVLTSLASRAKANVIAISRRPYALQLAQQMGATERVLLDEHHTVIERVQELTSGRMCERVIEATGKQWPLDLASELTCTRARLIIAGYHQDGPRQVNMQMWNWHGLDVVNAHERDEEIYVRGINKAVEAAASGLFDPRTLCTHIFPLTALADALEATLSRPEGFLKATVSYE